MGFFWAEMRKSSGYFTHMHSSRKLQDRKHISLRSNTVRTVISGLFNHSVCKYYLFFGPIFRFTLTKCCNYASSLHFFCRALYHACCYLLYFLLSDLSNCPEPSPLLFLLASWLELFSNATKYCNGNLKNGMLDNISTTLRISNLEEPFLTRV